LKTLSNPKIQQEIYASIEKNAPAVFCQFSWSDECRPFFLYAEGKLKSAFGFSQEDEQDSFWDWLDHHDRDILKSRIIRSGQDLSTVQWEGKIHTQKGRKWLKVYFEPKQTNYGVVWSGVITDISGLRQVSGNAGIATANGKASEDRVLGIRC
jgi:PAS domain-containing protein